MPCRTSQSELARARLPRLLSALVTEPLDRSTLQPLPPPIVAGQPLTALAPMQDVTDEPFMRVIASCGAPDYFFTEFFRVHAQSSLEKTILPSIVENQTGRPVFAQMIGEDIPHLVRAARDLLRHPVAGIDLNMGCPAPRVYRKNVGGGLLRDPEKVDEILSALRAATPGLFTVKMRIGFEDTGNFERLLDLVEKHRVDLLSLHARTVKEMYGKVVHYDFVKRAAERLPCPVLANGDVSSARKAREVLEYTGAAGVMVGRHAIRNPWIFAQIRQEFAGKEPTPVTLADVHVYVSRLYVAVTKPFLAETARVSKMKKYLNFVGQSVDPDGAFLREMRRATSRDALFEVCDRHLLSDPGRPFHPEPFEGVLARPSREGSCG